ncbi:hypothetical protein BCT62_08670 [Vibrio splendidus]|nr:hypothetical protein BCT62_08670 [Vibrio splendidus]PMN35181.1 hypothetical protein BCT36_24555 [Vibrio splendidus]
MLKGTLFLLLKNAPKLSDKQSDRVDNLLESNKTLCTIYMLKEQLQPYGIAAGTGHVHKNGASAHRGNLPERPPSLNVRAIIEYYLDAVALVRLPTLLAI